MTTTTGTDYVARVELTDKAGAVVAAVGQTCERVDPASLGWLLAQGLVARVEPVVQTSAQEEAE